MKKYAAWVAQTTGMYPGSLGVWEGEALLLTCRLLPFSFSLCVYMAERELRASVCFSHQDTSSIWGPYFHHLFSSSQWPHLIGNQGFSIWIWGWGEGHKYLVHDVCERCLTTFVIRELQIEARFHHPPEPKTLMAPCAGDNVEQQQLAPCPGECRMALPLYKPAQQPLTNQTYSCVMQQSCSVLFAQMGWKLSPQNLHTDVYGSFTHNCQNLATAKMSFTRRMC